MSHYPNHRHADQVDRDARTLDEPTCSTSKECVSDRCDPALHPPVRRLPAELPAPLRDDGRARPTGGPFLDQRMDRALLSAHREGVLQTQTAGWRQLVHA